MTPGPRPWSNADLALFARAREVLDQRYRPHRHTVAAALRTSRGKVYTGVCLDGLHSPCAETIAFGSAVMDGDPTIQTIVAVSGKGVLSPCGNCRQMLIDYAPEAEVLVQDGRRRLRVRASDLLPFAFHTFG